MNVAFLGAAISAISALPTGMPLLYIDPTAITTSLVSASGIIIALGASAGVLLGTAAVAGASVGAFFARIGRKIYDLFCIVENEGKTVEPDITVVRRAKK